MSTLTPPLDIRTVGVVGAGLNGIVTAAHLIREGINVTVFERANSPGGAWKFNPEADRDPPFPSIQPPTPDWHEIERLRESGLSLQDAAKIFDPPGPVYANMKTRGSEGIMRTSLQAWPEGKRAPWDHTEVLAYLRQMAQAHHVQEHIVFRTRVESILKSPDGNQWQVQTSSLVASSSTYTLSKDLWNFDAVVVARVPDIPGLCEWKHIFPGRVTHAKQFRVPEPYRGRMVLIVGAFISALEITNDLVKNGARVYQSARDTKVDFREKVHHENAEKVAMVAEFTLHESTPAPTIPEDNSPIPGGALLQDGRFITDIHDVIIATG